ncbi:MAG: PTS sugar transporter subunit IIA [Opitutaceae bacterium]|jgi:mannitol/fructose-specific phosphotransferase system IIA component (Ntr-type)
MADLISRLLDPSRILLNMRNPQRTNALHELAELFNGNPDVTSFDGFYRELLARDRLDTTCLGNGVALPHARTEHVKTIVMGVGRSEKGILFGEAKEPVHLLFMLGTPKTKPGDYLQVVSSLCKLLKVPANMEAFLTAPTPEAFIAAVVAAERKLNPS